MKVFIAGPRMISTLDDNIMLRLNNITNNNIDVLIGDAVGIDKTIQEYIHLQNYRNVTVYASNGKARNNVGKWPVHCVETGANNKGFNFYVMKDMEMAKNADYGFMIWNGESKGTLNNMINLVSLEKKTVLYFFPQKKFFNINSMSDISEVIEECPDATGHLFDELLRKNPLAVELQQPMLVDC